MCTRVIFVFYGASEDFGGLKRTGKRWNFVRVRSGSQTGTRRLSSALYKLRHDIVFGKAEVKDHIQVRVL